MMYMDVLGCLRHLIQVTHLRQSQPDCGFNVPEREWCLTTMVCVWVGTVFCCLCSLFLLLFTVILLTLLLP